jgi:hypothetical protein
VILPKAYGEVKLPFDHQLGGSVVRLEDHARSASTSYQAEARTTAPRNVANSTILSRPRWEEEVLNRVRFLLGLAENWDGAQARRLDYSTAQFGIKLLQYLLPPGEAAPKLAPLCYGGLQLEWFSKDYEFEIEIARPYSGRALFHDVGKDSTTEIRFDYDIGELKKLLANVISREHNTNEATAA